ncbi:unknown protein [Synechococcus elongatus PCC 6301]|uniref:Vanillate O-demethylase oxygenase-like C-terminal catalytic domain-containing protein n=1 Tax=Synechococcus sp. (strain ATCC 27144 / PCC 6301 / SAUG 1402/1) TaxID=269084 RepID=A0A0H3K4Q7_SYNP6|nr:hypothetical protein [Synechococcus elongatus]BAD80250.1 unknown protein [Synechococcus elongatus PCC 6301]
MPCIVRTETDLGNGFRFIGYGANLPIDAETTKTFWLTVRTFFTGAWADGDTVRRSLKIIEEDKRIVETQRPKMIPLDDRSETHVAADALQIGLPQLAATSPRSRLGNCRISASRSGTGARR